MKAVVTNIKGDYFYEVENIVNVQYVNNSIILTLLVEDRITTSMYSSKEVIINISGGLN